MLRVVTGAFHPDLEDALATEVRQLKADDPLTPIAVIVPSTALRQRLRQWLCLEQGLTLLDVPILTFHQLAVRLLEEADDSSPQQVRPSIFFHELLHHLLAKGVTAPMDERRLPRWGGMAGMPGAWAALWATVKDLKDARVEWTAVVEAIRSTEDIPRQTLVDLLELYAGVLEEAQRLQVCDRDDLAARALDHVPRSPFLSSRARLLYYGFYDLTQVQTDLFRGIAKAYPTTLFFPLLRRHPAFAFAERFFERQILGLLDRAEDWTALSGQGRRSASTLPLRRLFARADQVVPSAGEPGDSDPGRAAAGPTLRIVTVSGRDDEVAYTAKEILRLVEEQGYAFHDIGVVGRTLLGYETLIPRLFAQQRIPFNTTSGRSLADYPYVKTVVQLLGLGVGRFRREDVIDVLLSPFLRRAALYAHEGDVRPDLWDLASRRLGITRGLDEWNRLEPYRRHGLPLRDDEEPGEPGTGAGPRIPADTVSVLHGLVTALAGAVGRLEPEGDWNHYAETARDLCLTLLDTAPAPSEKTEDAAGEVVEALLGCFAELTQLAVLQPRVELAAFIETLGRLVDGTTVPTAGQAEGGVQVMDAMTARGVPIRVLFLLGLNEKVFPRYIQEDPFLRDRERRWLEADLGFKIQEKLAGYEEERLLFYLLVNAARDQLILLSQRTDATGRVLVPSLYLDEVREAVGGPLEASVPRRLSDKLAELPQFIPERLTVGECLIRSFLLHRRPHASIEEAHPHRALIRQGLQALEEQDSGRDRLNAHDGITGPLEDYWSRMQAKGVAPTTLQDYAACPFRFFGRHVLGLEPLPEVDAAGQLAASDAGTLVHELLNASVLALKERGYFAADGGRPTIDPSAVLREVAGPVFQRFAETHPTGYPLLWELTQQALLEQVDSALRDDLAAMRDPENGGWEPLWLEEPMQGRLEVPLDDRPETFSLSGRLDRVDWNAAQRTYRVIDYKYKLGRQAHTLDKNLPLGAVRGIRLQPPFYAVMADQTFRSRPLIGGAGAQAVCEAVWFYYIAPNWGRDGGDRVLTRASFPGQAWETHLRGPLLHALGVLLGGVKSGRFFIAPGAYCESCDMRPLCRKTHRASGWRARADGATVNAHRELRRVKLDKDGGTRGQAPPPSGDQRPSGKKTPAR